MRLIILTLITLLISSWSFAITDAQLQKRMDEFKALQDRITKECINNPNSEKYTVKMDGKTLKCADLILIADQLKKKLDQDVLKYKQKCEADAKKTPHAQLASDAATIAQKSISCRPAADKDQCLGKLTCAMISPAAAVAGLFGNEEAKKCAAEAKNFGGLPACVQNLARGIFDSIWGFVGLLWDAGKWAVTSVAEWTGLIRESEAATSEKLMMAQQADPGFLKRFASDPVGTMKKVAADLYAAIEDAAINHYGCEKWSGAPFISTCVQPMQTWDCGTCQQKAQVWCGVGGYAIGEIGTAFLVGGLVSGAKIALKGAVRLGSVPASNISSFMSKTFPKASLEVAEAANRVKLMASAGLSATQQRLINSWDAIAKSEVTKTIGNIARKTGVAKATSLTLKPISAYLSAMDKSFVAGMDTVDKFATGSKVAVGAKIAEESMGVGGLVVESAEDAAKLKSVALGAESSSISASPTLKVQTEVKGAPKGTQGEQASGASKAEETIDLTVYKTDPEYKRLFDGPEMYKGHHEELGTVIREMEKMTPVMTKEQIRLKIQETLNSCSL